MDIEVSKRFEKQLNAISDKKLISSIALAVNDVRQSKNLSAVHNIKKLKGYKNAYRIRVGDHRIGILLVDNTAHFMDLLHRKEIYKYFP